MRSTQNERLTYPPLAHERDPLPCQGANAELFFAGDPKHVEHAKALCTACALRRECLAGAVRRAEPWGVWGGQLFVDGSIVERKRGRGRPRRPGRPVGNHLPHLDEKTREAAAAMSS